MPEISRFFGIIIRMYYDDHAPPHLHAEYEGRKVLLDFQGNILRGALKSKTELQEDWELARARRELKKINPLG
jgi:predicted lipid-binding transport protein (Tim44 family)